jgi:hypothetical protein
VSADVPGELQALTPAELHGSTELAQRFLASAYDSANGVIRILNALRASRIEQRGRRSHEKDVLLRAGIVFACAGLDASLKQVIHDALPLLLEVKDESRKKFDRFAAEYVAPENDVVSPQRLVGLLTSSDPRAALIDAHVYQLTGSSLQSAEEVERICGV